MFRFKHLLIAGSLLFLAQGAHAQDVYVSTESGLAHGLIDGGMRAFRGLRYAAPPLGDLRWRDPEPPPLCPNGLCEATNFGPICLQIKASGVQDGSEDCLTLNVFTPVNAGPGTRLPVMFFVH